MSKVEIKIVPRSIRLSSGGRILGPISVVLGGAELPEKGWVDEVVGILACWCAELAGLSERESFALLPFKDRRCRLLVQRWLEGADVSVIALGLAGTETRVGLDTLRRKLRDAGSRVLVGCSKRGIVGPEVDRLQEALGWLDRGERPSGSSGLWEDPAWGLPQGRLTFFVDETHLEQVGEGNIFGAIEIRGLSPKPFPAPGWTDFVVVVLAWWCRALANWGSRLQCISFMDGPHEVLLQRHPQLRQLIVEQVGGGPGLCLVDERELQLEVLQASRRVETACAAKGWQGKEIRELEEASAALAKLLESRDPKE